MTKPPVRTRRRVSSNDVRLGTRYVDPDRLRPPEPILRMHTARQIKMISASIARYGFVNPILVGRDGRIVSGYGRWLAAKALGIPLVPVIELAHMTAEELRIYAIADNRIAEQSEFDFDALKIELAALEALDLDFSIELTGFSTGDIDELLAIPALDEENDGVEPDDPQVADVAVTRSADFSQLGGHRLVCGRCWRQITGSDATLVATGQTISCVPAAGVIGRSGQGESSDESQSGFADADRHTGEEGEDA